MTSRVPPDRAASTPASDPIAFSLQHADPVVWAATLDQLAADGSPSALQTLEQMATSRSARAADALVSVRAAITRLEHPTLPGLPFLRWCFTSTEDAIRERAATRMAAVLAATPVHAADELIASMTHDPSARVRFESVSLLGHLRDADTRASCLDLLRSDPEAAVRRIAATTYPS